MPGIDDISAGDDSQPSHNGHNPGPGHKAAHPFGNAGISGPFGVQVYQLGQAAGVGQQRERAEPHAVDDCSYFSSG